MSNFTGKERLFELLLRKLAGELTLLERSELIKLLKDPNNNKLGELFENIYLKERDILLEDFEDSKKTVGDKLFKKIQEDKGLISNDGDIWQLKPRIGYRRYMSVAALLIILIGLPFLIYRNNLETVQKGNKTLIASTNKGSKSNLVLPDGTTVWMNSDSKLTYDEAFGKTTRNVTLVGEAFFDVVKDKDRPFIVHTSSIDIKVLGTAFNVKAYSDDKSTQATLLRGLIEVTLKNYENEKITLRPNHKIVIQNNLVDLDSVNKDQIKRTPFVNILKVNQDNADSSLTETAWVKNKLLFEKESLEDLIPVLEKWFDVHFVINNSVTLSKKFTGSYQNENIEEVLESLKLFEDFDYKIEKNIIQIY